VLLQKLLVTTSEGKKNEWVRSCQARREMVLKYYDEIGKWHYKRLIINAGDVVPSRQPKSLRNRRALFG